MNLSSALRTLADHVAEAEAAGITVRMASMSVHLEDDTLGVEFAERVGIDRFRASGPTQWVDGTIAGVGLTVFCEDRPAVKS
ncbi:hypothetical protein [Aeromicrobium sp. Leaf291]|uniref:hypothetical protein n=1 Tax=Aeromicrobium sp. Leaf291 TaxID=1736325 RepID=UPI0006FD7C29|nr:hypothetical protein [Aeromicrobium sp. Leaf291]KQP83777.1 hypothetical protein ASF35_02000 [Aeromicrobium sp. Leaf291]